MMNLPSLYRQLGILLERRGILEAAIEVCALNEEERLNSLRTDYQAVLAEINKIENLIDSIEQST